MEFKEKIILHNEGKYDFAGELISLALTHVYETTMTMTLHAQQFRQEDNEEEETLMLPRWRPQYAEGKTFEEKLARNIKIWIARYTKTANSVRNKKAFEGTQYELMHEGQDPLHLIYSVLTDYGYHYYKDDFDKVPKRVWKEIEQKEGYYFMDKVRSEFKEFLNILPLINREKEKLQDQYVPLIEDALKEVLPKVDTSRSETEIIGLIAVAAKRELNRKLTKALDTKVHNINGEKYYVTKRDIRAKGFKKLKANNILQVDESKLSARQSLFFGMLSNRIQKEIDTLNVEPFTFDPDGIPIDIKKRYFAEQMDMEESAFKHRLRRIQKVE